MLKGPWLLYLHRLASSSISEESGRERHFAAERRWSHIMLRLLIQILIITMSVSLLSLQNLHTHHAAALLNLTGTPSAGHMVNPNPFLNLSISFLSPTGSTASKLCNILTST